MSDVQVKLSTDNSSFSSGLKKAEAQVSTFGSSVKNIGANIKGQFAGIANGIAGAFAVTGILAFFDNLRQEMDRIQKLGQQLDLGVEEIQRLKAAAGLAGTDIEALVKTMRKGQGAAIDAVKGNRTLAEAFKALGIDAKGFSEMGLEAKVLELARALEQSGDQIAANDTLLTILGPKAAELLPLLKSGVGALSAEMERASTVTQETIDDIAEMNDAIDRVKNDISAGLAPVIAFVFKLVSSWIVWFKANVEGLTFSIVALGDVIGTAFADGFDAAKAKLQEYRKAFKEMAEEAGAEIKGIWKEEEGGGNSPGAGGMPESGEPTASGKDTAESLKKKNDERQKAAAKELLSLEQKRAILLGEISINRQRGTVAQTELEREQFREKVMNAQDELALVDKSIAAERKAKEDALMAEHDAIIKEQEDASKAIWDKQKKDNEEAAKKDVEQAETALAEGERKLSELESGGFQLDLDSFQRAGGSYGKENRAGMGETLDSEKQAIEEQKQTNVLLRQILDKAKASYQGLTSA